MALIPDISTDRETAVEIEGDRKYDLLIGAVECRQLLPVRLSVRRRAVQFMPLSRSSMVNAFVRPDLPLHTVVHECVIADANCPLRLPR